MLCSRLSRRHSRHRVTRMQSWRNRRTSILGRTDALQDSSVVPLEIERALEVGVGIEKRTIST